MRIFVYMHYLEIGGAERALIGLLNAFRGKDVEVDLHLNQHTGEFMPLIPRHIRLLPQLPEYSAIERRIVDIVKEGHIGMAIRRLIGKHRYSKYRKHIPLPEGKIENAIFQYIFRQVTPALRDLSYLGEYDLAISFLHPHNIVLEKVRAKKKACWIHTDYSTVSVNNDIELPVWDGFDHVVAISDEAGAAFARSFPTLAPKIVTIENILSPASIRSEAATDVSAEMPRVDGRVNILSIGRFCAAKRFDEVPRICRYLLDHGLDFRWYIVGYGDDASTIANIERYGVADHLILLGKKANPYPYIAACDIYAQPSLYEGKSVTVREAQILSRPVVITDYPTARSQVIDGVDGRIVPLDIDGCAEGILRFIQDEQLRRGISDYLSTHDYGNENEVDKVLALAE